MAKKKKKNEGKIKFRTILSTESIPKQLVYTKVFEVFSLRGFQGSGKQ